MGLTTERRPADKIWVDFKILKLLHRLNYSGYVTYTGLVLQVNNLLQHLESASRDPGVQHYFKHEEERCLQSVPPPSGNPVLIDPLDKLRDIVSVRDVIVDDLVQALKPTAEEVELIQAMSVGQ